MTNNRVKSYAERIERLLDERATIDADIKDIYTEVKSADLKPKVLRKAIANKRRKVDKQFEEEVEEYAALLLALPGATYRSVAEKTGVPKSTLQRRVPRERNGTRETPTTEADSSGDDAGHRSEPSPPAEQSVNSIPSSGPVQATSINGEGGQSGTHSDDGESGEASQGGESRLATSDCGTTAATPPFGTPEREARAPAIPDDDLAIPDFLRRPKVTAS